MLCIGIKLEFSTTLFAKIVHFMGREGFMRVNSVSNDSFYGMINCRIRKNWRDIYFLMLTRPGHFFLYLSVAVPVVRNWLTRYGMKDMDIIFHMVLHKSM